MEKKSPATQTSHVNQTNEGTHVTGNVNTGGGGFVGRDQAIYGDEVHGNKIERGGVSLEVTGVALRDISASGNVHIHDIYAGITYQNVLPLPADAATLKAANARLAKLPLNRIPPVAPLPFGSSMPISYNRLFVGREDALHQMAAALKGGKTMAIGQITAATGLGGIGKTQLAVAFVHHYGQYFAGGVHWLNFTDPNALLAEIAKCGLTMPDVRADFAHLDLETQVRLVLAAWQSPLPRLLVFDNCEEPALLVQWRPPTGGSRILITSRRPTWDADAGVSVVALDTLTREQSIELLRKFPTLLNKLPFTADEGPVLSDVAAELGDLPLALHVAGNYLARYRYEVSPGQYLRQLRQPSLLHHRSLQQSGLTLTGHTQDVARTFALSYERLNPSDPVDVLAQALLARAAWFAPGQLIPRALLRATIQLSEESALQAADALQRLTNLGLVEMETAGNLLLHRLLMHFVQSADEEAAQVAQNAVAAALLAEANRINSAGIPGPLLAWQIHLRAITEAAFPRADETAASLCNTLAFHFQIIGAYAAAKPYYEQALAIRRAVVGEQHPDTATSLNNLGGLLHAMGDLAAAKPYFEQALATRRAVLGEQHPDTAQSLHDLGGLLRAMGELAAAKPYYEQALAIRRAVLGEQHPSTATSLNNLGGLLRATGDLAAAKPYFEQALATRRAVLGEQHPDTGRSLNNLGGLLRTMGELAAAKPYLEQALAIRRQVLGEQHPHTGRSLNNLGGLLREMGELTAAKPYIEQALAIRWEALGEQHPDTAQSLNHLGVLLQAMGELTAAKPYYEQALTIHLAVLGEQHPDTAQSLNHLGGLLRAMGELTAGKPYLERALAIFADRLGASHPYTERVRSNLAKLITEIQQEG